MKISGIYLIRNVINNKKYVGSTIDLRQRWGEHRRTLRLNQHRNIYLQRAWNKYGEENFEFTFLEECSENMLLIREDAWINYYDSIQNGYNLVTAKRHSVSEKTRANMSIAQKKYSKEHPRMVERRIKYLSKINKGNKYCVGHKASPEAKINLSKSRIGNKNRLGIPHSLDSKKKISEAGRGRVQSESEKQKRREQKKLFLASPAGRQYILNCKKRTNWIKKEILHG